MKDIQTSLWILVCVIATGLINFRVSEAQSSCFQNCTLVSPQHLDCDHERLIVQDACIVPYDTSSASLRYNNWKSMNFIGKERIYHNLENLTVSHNQIESIGGRTFTQTPYLVYLDLSYNKLASISVGELPLPFLKNLSLYHNVLNYTNSSTPVGIFTRLKSLKFLDFRLGHMDTRKCPNMCPDEIDVRLIRHLEDLEELRFTTPNVFPAEGSLSNLTKLRCVIISECTIGIVTNDTFAVFRDLPVITLSLRKTNLFKVEKAALRSTLSLLQRIDLSCNTDFGSYPQHLDDFWANFNGSNLSTFVCDRVASFTGTFNMSLGAMMDASSANLHVVSIRGGKNFFFSGTTFNPNALEDYNVFKHMFHKMRYLRGGDSSTYMFFTGPADIRNLDSSASEKLRIGASFQNLRVFDAPSIQMSFLDISYEDRINCEELDPLLFQDPPDPGPLSTNITDDEIEDDIFNLSNILARYIIEGKITIPPRLQEIRIPLFGGKLTPAACPGGTLRFYERNNIKKIHVSGTKIPRFICVFTGLLYLEDLTLQNMKLEEMHIGFFGNLSALRQLDLSYNSLGPFFNTQYGARVIKEISSTLLSLRLTGNRVVDFSEDTVLAQLTNLTSLDLSENELSTLTLTLFKNTRLEYVNLSFNKLTSFEYISRHPLIYNFNVSLRHNSFLCTDCGSLPLIDWLFSSEAHRRVSDRLLIQCQNHEYQDKLSLVRFKNITSETSLKLQYDCRKDEIFIFSGLLTVAVFIIAVLILAMESDYRWKIVHWWYYNYYKVKRVFFPFEVTIPIGNAETLVIFVVYRPSDRNLAKSIIEHLEGSREAPHHICLELEDICKPNESVYECTGMLVDTCDLVIPIISDSLEDSGDMVDSHVEEQGPSGNDDDNDNGTGDEHRSHFVNPGIDDGTDGYNNDDVGYADGSDDEDSYVSRGRRGRAFIRRCRQQSDNKRIRVMDTIYEFGLCLSLTKGIDSIIFISKNLEPDRFPHFPLPVRNLLKKGNCCVDVGDSETLTNVSRFMLDGIVETFLKRRKYV